jgi:hypothetical protein
MNNSVSFESLFIELIGSYCVRFIFNPQVPSRWPPMRQWPGRIVLGVVLSLRLLVPRRWGDARKPALSYARGHAKVFIDGRTRHVREKASLLSYAVLLLTLSSLGRAYTLATSGARVVCKYAKLHYNYLYTTQYEQTMLSCRALRALITRINYSIQF